MYTYIHIYIYIYIIQIVRQVVPPEDILAIFYPPLKYLGGCFWLFYRLRRETPISQNWLEG